MTDKKHIIRIGTRGSKLALVQTNLVIDALKSRYPNLACEVVIIKTMGDKILNKPLLEFGGKAVFVNEFEDMLLDHQIDFAVHSAKDMPMELAKGLHIAGVLKREDPRDVLITRKSFSWKEEDTVTIGTSSLRRQLQIEALYPNVSCKSLRGNIDTRLKKLLEGQYDGIILAAAGINRLNRKEDKELSYQRLDFNQMIPACGQGIIAIEGRMDSEYNQYMKEITDSQSWQELRIERNALRIFQAGCHEAIGIFSKIKDNNITLYMMREVEGKIIKRTGEATLNNVDDYVNEMVHDILEER